MSNTTNPQKCEPLSGVPASLPIPKGINYAAVQGRNGSEPWMVKCCTPNPVNLVDGCWVWCQLPKERITTLPDGKKETDFMTCLKQNGRDRADPSGMLFEVNAPSSDAKATRVTTKGLGVWAVGMAGMVIWGM
ncbi:hypothetical protein QBC39DRAFT_362945 [Podospora conica]|nr:hypothetical protein QBC39DRAFT_362945 [Schizothecium conicum]